MAKWTRLENLSKAGIAQPFSFHIIFSDDARAEQQVFYGISKFRIVQGQTQKFNIRYGQEIGSGFAGMFGWLCVAFLRFIVLSLYVIIVY